MRNDEWRFSLWKITLIASAGSPLLTPSQPTWIHSEAQFLLSPFHTAARGQAAKLRLQTPFLSSLNSYLKFGFACEDFFPAAGLDRKGNENCQHPSYFILEGFCLYSPQKAVKWLFVTLPQLTARISNRQKEAWGFRRVYICGDWKRVPAQMTDGVAGMNAIKFIKSKAFAHPWALLLYSILSLLAPFSHDMTSQSRRLIRRAGFC